MSALDDEAVDWSDAEGVSMEQAGEAGDDVISLGGAEDLEEEIVISVPVESKKNTAKEKVVSDNGMVNREITSSEAAAATAPSRPLPPGWRLQEARSGGTYYFNTNTGKTTWDFPSEEAAAPSVVPEKTSSTTVEERPRDVKVERPAEIIKAGATKAPVEVNSKPATEKMGIQIKGAARGNSSTFRKEDISPVPDNKKREAETQPSESDDKAVNYQKRRRSNTPPEAKVESHPKETSRGPSAPAPLTSQQDRKTEVAPERKEAVKGGWGRRADIAREEVSLGPKIDRSRTYDQDRNGRGEMGSNIPRNQKTPTHPSRRETIAVNEPQRREAAPDGRDRSYQKDAEREASRNAYESRRVSHREERPRETRESRREPSPVSRRRDDYEGTNGREVSRSDRDMTRSRDAPSAPREPERAHAGRDRDDHPRTYPDREYRASRERTNERDASRSYDDRRRDAPAPVNSPRNVVPSRDDRSNDQRPYINRNHNGSTNDFNDRRNGSFAPYPAQNAMQQGFGYGPARGNYPKDQYRYAPVAPLNTPMPFSPGVGPPRGPLSAGAKPLKSWISPEEKQKRWWNKNTGERKPVSADGSTEGEPPSRHRDSSHPTSSEPQLSHSTSRMTDRERELAEREAAIAQKERELGLR